VPCIESKGMDFFYHKVNEIHLKNKHNKNLFVWRGTAEKYLVKRLGNTFIIVNYKIIFHSDQV
jgi:hypothetical protein